MKHLRTFEAFTDYTEYTLVEIRSAKNSYSSRDLKAYKAGNQTKILKDFFNAVEEKIENLEIDGIVYKIYDFTIASTDRERVLRTLVNSYSFLEGFPEQILDTKNLNYRNYNLVQAKSRTDQGYVIGDYSKKPNLNGSFSTQITNISAYQNYIKDGVAFGYIGHSARKHWLDVIIEQEYLPYIEAEKLVTWLTSSDARHFMDSIEEEIDKDDKEAVRKIIKDNLKRVHDKSLIYSHPEHSGTYASTIEITKKLEAEGKLLNFDKEVDI